MSFFVLVSTLFLFYIIENPVNYSTTNVYKKSEIHAKKRYFSFVMLPFGNILHCHVTER
jgi:hypothetical protein